MLERTLPRLVLVILALGLLELGHAQNESDERALITIHDGIRISQDSLFLLNLRFRMQNRLGFSSISGNDLSINTVDARVRRLRLRLDGFVKDMRLRYYIQLNFSRADLDQDVGGVAQPVRDAMVYFHFNRNLYIGFGQSKLPGNRERVISSGNLQFPDRSIANAAYTLDRDFGLFAYWTIPMADQELQLKGALSSGDGRGTLPVHSGMAYTGRVEWLPFGKFANTGDYSEGDLEFEPTPKLSIGTTFSFNDDAYRTGGQLGNVLYDTRDIRSGFVDAMFKYRGWAVLAEYFDRRCDDPITVDAEGNESAIPTGGGSNMQLSRVFRNHFELALRYSSVDPAPQVADHRRNTQETLVGATQYINGHRIKLQLYTGYRWVDGRTEFDAPGNSWTALFQVEFGI